MRQIQIQVVVVVVVVVVAHIISSHVHCPAVTPRAIFTAVQ